MEIDYEALFQVFLAESKENLGHMEEALVVLETHPDDEETLFSIFRTVHTIKGSASCLGFQTISEFAHDVEDALQRLVKRTVPVTPKIITLLLKSVDAFKQMASAAGSQSTEIPPEHKELLDQFVAAMNEAATSDQQQKVEEKVATATDQTKQEHQQKPSETEHQSDIKHEDQARTIRVDLEKLDIMLNLTGEIAIAQDRLRQLIQGIDGTAGQNIMESYLEAERLYKDFQDQMLNVRMVPLGPTFRKYFRTIRDVATSQGKLARLVIEDGGVEVDTTVIECIREPINHLICNTINHGIELPDTRRAMGKDSSGLITLRAFYDSGCIAIQLRDDGAGFDRQRIVERALAQGLISDPESLTEQEIYQLTFKPGFSSESGMGLDIVQRNIAAVRGTIAIDSRKGEGATISIKLPLTLSIIEGLSVGVSSETFVIPLETVVECLDLSKEEGNQTGSYGVINLRGQPLPYLRLRNHFALGAQATTKENIVVVQSEGRRVGIAVDRLYGESQTVIKPLGKLFDGLDGVSGSAIMGDGRVALILDVPAILRQTLGRTQFKEREAA